MLEIEVKIQVRNKKDIVEKLLKAGALLKKERSFEENWLYDFKNGFLQKKRTALRLRTIGKKHFLTFKGPPQKSRKFKIRDEYETEIKNRKQLENILKVLEFKPSYYYKKYRTQYKTSKLNICLDETEVGIFLELEGKQSDIVRFTEALNLSKKDYIKKDYIQLLNEKKNL